MVHFDRMGESGNIFCIMGSASHELKERGRADDAKEMVERVIKSESYDDALEIIGEYVELEERKMSKLTILNYDSKRCETDIDMANVNSLYVVVITGDEVVTAVLEDGSQITFDSAELSDDRRAHDYFDGEYGVHKDDLERWTKRKDSYEWFSVLKGGDLDAEV